MNKSEIRKKILKVRRLNNYKSLKIDYLSILKILKKKNIKGKILGGYYSFNYEVDVLKILQDFEGYDYNITLPKIKKNFKMDFFDWSTNEPLSVNKYGIPEPISNKIKFPDILLVPLVAYDKNLNRVGYGGGFYDRYIKIIKKYKKVITIGLAYSFQKVNKIPVNENDMKLDIIITEKKN